MPRQQWSDDQREAALMALHDGATLGQVHADTGIPKGTLASWKRRQDERDREQMRADLFNADPEGWEERTTAAETRLAQTEAARVKRRELDADDRLQMAARLREEVHQLLDRINAPTTYKHVKVVAQGGELGQAVEVVDVELDLPTAGDTKALVTSAAILVDKLQLLTGEATERTEHMTGEQIDLDAEYARLVSAAQSGELHADKAADQ